MSNDVIEGRKVHFISSCLAKRCLWPEMAYAVRIVHKVYSQATRYRIFSYTY